MSTLNLARATGVLLLSAVLMGCSSTPAPVQDRTPSWMKYQVSSSRIARRTDAKGRPISADFVHSTTPEGLLLLPAVTVVPCSGNRRGC